MSFSKRLLVGLLGLLLVGVIACAEGVSDRDVADEVDRALAERLPQALDQALDDRLPAVAATITAGVAATIEASQPTATPSSEASPTPTVLPGTPTPTPDPGSPPPTPTPLPPPTPTPPPTATPDPLDPVEGVRAAIVRIETPHGHHTGVIVHRDLAARTARVLTNAHVTAGAATINVIVGDSQRYTGRLVGEDTRRDLALIEICCGTGFVSIPMVDSLTVAPGEAVNIFGYRAVSVATASRIEAVVLDTRYNGGRDRSELVLDTTLQPGLSGSAIVLRDGRLLGLGTYSVTSGSPDEHGFGFAVSQTTLAAALPSLQSGPFAISATTIPPEPGAGGPLFGPSKGGLPHNPDAPQIVRSSASVDAANVVISATFVNPYSHAEGTWSYGFEFRSKDNARHTLYIRSHGSWTHWINDAAGNPVRVVEQHTSSHIHTSGGARNTLRVIALGSQGWFFINNQYVGSLNLLGLEDAGNVNIITGVVSGDQRDGYETMYEEFTVTLIGPSAGLSSGTLVRHTPGFIATRGAGVNFSDSIATARLINPPTAGGAGWTYGFLIRRSDVNTFHAVFIDNTGRWSHHVRDGSSASDQRVTNQASTAINTNPSASNTLRLISSGPVGALFINGVFAGTLDLSTLSGGGDVSLIGGYFNSDQPVGVETRYEDFTVRPLR